jgi:hypothetical protein
VLQKFYLLCVDKLHECLKKGVQKIHQLVIKELNKETRKQLLFLPLARLEQDLVLFLHPSCTE